MFAPVCDFEAIRTSCGSLGYMPVIRWIDVGMVAENSATWRLSPTWPEDLLDVLGEAHLEHPVGLIEDEVLEDCRVSANRA